MLLTIRRWWKARQVIPVPPPTPEQEALMEQLREAHQAAIGLLRVPVDAMVSERGTAKEPGVGICADATGYVVWPLRTATDDAGAPDGG